MLAKEFDAEVVDTFRINKIDGETLLELTQEEMKELGIVALGDRKKLVKLTKTLLTMKGCTETLTSNEVHSLISLKYYC